MTRALSIQPFDLSNGTISVLSIDFFDTLVTRNVAQPTHVFAVMEKTLLEKGQRHRHGFARIRIEAERDARVHQEAIDDRCDVTIEEIYHQLQIRLGINYGERVSLMEMEMDLSIDLT